MKNSILYSIAVIALGWIGLLIDHLTNAATPGTPGMLIWILAPMIASFGMRLFDGEGWKDLGWQPRFEHNVRTYLISILYFPVVILPVMALDRFTGIAACPPALPTAGDALHAFGLLLIPQIVQNMFEESGFRGYLAPKLLKTKLHPLFAHLLTGFVWGVWHLPYLKIIVPYSSEPMITFAPRFILGTMAASIMFGELRRMSNSLWPAVFAQTVGGALIGTILALGVRFPTLPQLFSPTIEGGLVIILLTVVGLGLMKRNQSRAV